MANGFFRSLGIALGLTRRPANDAAPAPPPDLAAERRHHINSLRAGFDGLTNMVGGLGTERDKRFYSEYSPLVTQSQQQLGAMYRGSWLARRIVNTPADDSTRAWVSLNWDGYDEGDANVRAVELAEKRYGLRKNTNTSRKWGRLYGGAGIVVVLKGEDRYTMASPLDVTKIGKDQLLRLHVLDRWRLMPMGTLDDDMSSPNFGLPTAYRVAETGTVLHWSRVIRFGGQQLPHDLWVQNQFWDDSVLISPMDSVKNYETATNGAASMIWEANVDILKIQGLADSLINDGEEAIRTRLLNAMIMKSFNRTLVIDKEGEDYEQKQMTFGGLNDVIANFVVDLCGAAEIPATRLFGQSSPGLNSTGESDIRNYYDGISSSQESDLRPQLERLYEIVIRSALGKMPENFSLTFNPLWQESKKEKAEVDKVRADTDAIYLREGVLTEGGVARELLDRKTYRTMEEKDVKLAQELAEAAAEAETAAMEESRAA